MNKFTSSILRSTFTMGVLALAVISCSKKNKTDTDVAAGDEMAVTDLSSGKALNELPPVFFEFDSFALTADSKSILTTHASWLKDHGGVRVQIEGHTDERGTTEYNLALGDRRAGAVKEFLISKGIPAARLQTISYGEERPVSTGNNEMAWAQNRRAEFVSAGK